MRKLTTGVALAVLVVAAACTDNTPTTGVRSASPGISKSTASGSLGACTTLSALTALANQVFGSGSPNVQSVIGKLNNLDHFVQQHDTANAQAQAQNIVSFVQQKAGDGRLAGTPAQIDAFIGGVLCYAGISSNTFLIQPTDDPQVIKSNTGNSGVSLQGHTVGVPTLLTINELDPNGPSGLQTKLDQYPTYIDISISSPLLDSAVVAVCIPASLGVTQDVFDRLRLGHQKSTGFELTPKADPSFLGCPTAVSAASKSPSWLRRVASLFLPKELYAHTMMFATGGVGGSSIEFSPFGAVDGTAFATGGVGGSSIEFQRAPSGSKAPSASVAAPGTSTNGGGLPPSRSVYDASGACLSADTTVGAPLSAACRPTVNIRTARGTLLTGVPISWSVTSGGGSIAADTLSNNACGTFGNTASNATDADGNAAVCWTLGPAHGTNSVTAIPAFGGDVPTGVVFLNSSGSPETAIQFTATGDLIPTTATATGTTAVFDALPHAGTGSCSNSLTPALTYDTPGGSAPTNAGTSTMTVTCGAGSDVYAVSTATATITITPATPVVAVSCPDSAVYTGSPLTPCSATVTAPALSTTATPSYTNNTNVGTATATASYAAGGNYTAGSGTATFRITKAASATAVSCPASVAYTAGASQNPCTATATGAGGLSTSVGVTYSPSPLHDAGSYSANAIFVGDANHLGSAGSGSFSIAKIGATATAGSGTMTYGGTVPSLPCTVTGLLSPDAGSVTCTTTAPATILPGNNATTPVVSPNSPVNYAMTSVAGNLTARYVQSGCFASPIYSSQPPTKSSQRVGSNLPIKCTLLTAVGDPVVGASGNLVVTDMGANGSGPGVVVFQLNNAFAPDSKRNYSYGYDTSNLVSGHFYIVTAAWNDGSTTTGWFYTK